MQNYDASSALDELIEDALLPSPSNLRDMLTRASLKPEEAVEMNRKLQGYLLAFGEAEKQARAILEKLAVPPPI
jgi:predicted metal-binding transcription factor (methanogenesis marker protein 9)